MSDPKRIAVMTLAAVALLGGPAPAGGPRIGEAQRLTGTPDAVLVPNYGIGYSYGAYPPPGGLVGPDDSVFDDGFAGLPGPAVVGVPPFDPSPTSIYAVSAPPGQRCTQVRAVAPGAPDVHWMTVCGSLR